MLVMLVNLINGEIIFSYQEILSTTYSDYSDNIMPGTLSMNSLSTIYLGWVSYHRNTFMRLDMNGTIPQDGIVHAAYVM